MNTNALRIAFQSPFPPYRGGIATFSRYVLESLQPIEGVKLIGYNYKALYPSLLFPGKTQYAEDTDSKLDSIRSVHAYNPLNWMSAAKEILAGKPDVYMYAHWHPFFCPVQLRIINLLKKEHPSLKVAGILHNVIPHEKFPLQQLLTRSLFHKTEVPIVLSSQTKDEFVSLNINREAVQLFHPVYNQHHPPGSLNEIRSELGIQPDETVLLFFGLIRPYKGLDILIEALNGLDMGSLKLRLFIVGEFYMDKQPILAQIHPDNSPFIHVRDAFVSDADAALYLKASDVMVMPYKTASQSGVLSNALNFHLPVICSNHPGLAEQVRHDVSGLLTEPENVEALREAIVSILDLSRRERLRAGTAELKETLSWTRFAQTLVQVLTN